MQVKSDKMASERSIKVEVVGGSSVGRVGIVVDTNKKSMRLGRQYQVEFDGGGTEWFTGSQLKEIK